MTDTIKAIRNFKIEGLVAAPCTAFKKNGDVDLEATEAHVQHLLDFGVPNAFITGTAGESMSMTIAERKQVMQAWVKYGKGKLRAIMAHIGAGNMRDSQELAAYAQEIGCEAIAAVGPSYFKPETINEYVEYMVGVASAAPKLPFYLYDINYASGINFDTNEFFHLAKDKIPNLRGIKHTTRNFVYMHNLVMDHGDRFDILIGSDELYLEALSIGIESTVICSINGIVLNRVKEAFDKGDLKTARMEQERVLKVCHLRRKHGFYGPAAHKGPLKGLLNLDFGSPRLPLKALDEDKIQAFVKDAEDIGYFEWGTK